MASVGDLQSQPYNRNDGFLLVVSCGVLQYAHRTVAGCLSHCAPNCAALLRNMVLSVQLNRSTIPSHSGW